MTLAPNLGDGKGLFTEAFAPVLRHSYNLPGVTEGQTYRASERHMKGRANIAVRCRAMPKSDEGLVSPCNGQGSWPQNDHL